MTFPTCGNFGQVLKIPVQNETICQVTRGPSLRTSNRLLDEEVLPRGKHTRHFPPPPFPEKNIRGSVVIRLRPCMVMSTLPPPRKKTPMAAHFLDINKNGRLCTSWPACPNPVEGTRSPSSVILSKRRWKSWACSSCRWISGSSIARVTFEDGRMWGVGGGVYSIGEMYSISCMAVVV